MGLWSVCCAVGMCRAVAPKGGPVFRNRNGRCGLLYNSHLEGFAARCALRAALRRARGLTRDYFRERAGKQNLETVSKDDIIIRQLRAIGVKGTIHSPKREIDVSSLTFDDAHINSQRQHGVTAAEAKNYIDNAPVSVTRWNGRFEDYFSHQGAAYVDMQKNEIRTAYSSAEFDEKAKAIMEVLKKNGK